MPSPFSCQRESTWRAKCYSNFDWKSLEKLIFLAFGKILVLVAGFFYSNFNWKSIGYLISPAFGKILVLVAAFFHSIFFDKALKKNPAFGKILVLMAAFFYSNST